MKASRRGRATPAEADRSSERLADSLVEPDAFARNALPAIEAPRLGGYRIAGNLELRSRELEQELNELRDRYAQQERELWRARRRARRYEIIAVTTVKSSKAGVGAALTSVLGMLLYFLEVVTAPPILFGIVLAGALVAVFLDAKKMDEDDGFPPAPPPRMPY